MSIRDLAIWLLDQSAWWYAAVLCVVVWWRVGAA